MLRPLFTKDINVNGDILVYLQIICKKCFSDLDDSSVLLIVVYAGYLSFRNKTVP